jgi:hypothetical protein
MGAPLTTTAADRAAVLERFCFAQPEAFLVPAEALSERGVTADFEQAVAASGRLTRAQLDCLGAGFALYWQRCRELYARAPRSWFPPRLTNLLIVTDDSGISPYLEPFGGTSSMLYLSDLDTHAEYVAALLVHMERLALLRSIPASFAYNLSYWFDRTPDERRAFATAAGSARRPDAAAFIALAAAFEWIDELLHDPLRAPREQAAEPFLHIDGADLYVPKRLQAQLVQLGAGAESTVRRVMTAPPSQPRNDASAARALDLLCEWLRDSRAHVIVHGPQGGTLWTPQHDDPVRVRRVLQDASDAAIASIHADLRIVDERSRQFLGRVADVESLPTSCAVLETGGGAYVDPARRAVIYELQQPAFDPRAGAAPPYHRLLLGARVMHEWGHVAHTAKILRLPDARRADYAQSRIELGERFAAVLNGVPMQFKEAIAAELQSIEPDTGAVPKALARKTLARVGDYLANMMCARLIPGEEMQAYVRTNVRHHLDENLGLVAELARYAYEVHYLGLAHLPRSYFYATSRFTDYFLDTGIIGERDAEALFDAAGRVLGCYEIDETRLDLSPRA